MMPGLLDAVAAAEVQGEAREQEDPGDRTGAFVGEVRRLADAHDGPVMPVRMQDRGRETEG